ncbi:MAG: LysR family transcriptional regulator [Halocynthiibacter sp.]
MSYFDNIRTFVRVYELGSMSAAARDQRISPAVASSRISQLEAHLTVRLFIRTTRSLQPTEQGTIFYDGACAILDSIAQAEASISDITQNPRGTLFIAAPFWIGRHYISPNIPLFKEKYPLIDLRLRLSDRNIDLAHEGLDMAFFLGTPEDSTLKMRKIADVERVLCAAPSYIKTHGHPKSGPDLIADNHACLLLRFPGAPDFQWDLQTGDGPRRFAVSGPFESDDGDVLTQWALDGQGIVQKPRFEVADELATGRLIEVVEETPPTPITLACLFAHRKHQDPKTRLFIEFMAEKLTHAVSLADTAKRAT